MLWAVAGVCDSISRKNAPTDGVPAIENTQPRLYRVSYSLSIPNNIMKLISNYYMFFFFAISGPLPFVRITVNHLSYKTCF